MTVPIAKKSKPTEAKEEERKADDPKPNDDKLDILTNLIIGLGNCSSQGFLWAKCQSFNFYIKW